MCKHIVLGVRQDFSEGSYLRRLFAHNSNRIRTTLLSDGPINPEMMTLRLREPLELDTVFESSHGSDSPESSTPLYPLI